jgi:hypothetical protein
MRVSAIETTIPFGRMADEDARHLRTLCEAPLFRSGGEDCEQLAHDHAALRKIAASGLSAHPPVSGVRQRGAITH